MSILEQLRSPAPLRASYAPWDDFWFKGVPQRAGLLAPVSGEQAMRLTTVWACIVRLGQGMASAPLGLYRRNGDDRERAVEHPLYRRLHLFPNGWMTAFELEQMAMTHQSLRGNFYARSLERTDGHVAGLLPLSPDRVTPRALPSGRLQYEHRRQDGAVDVYAQGDIHHRRGLSMDGIVGLSPIEYNALTLGLAAAGDAYVSNTFSGSAVPPFALRHPAVLEEPDQDRLRKSLAKYTAGDKYLILEEGMEVSPLGISARDAQILDTRKASKEDIAAIFNVPLHMLQIASPGAVSYASVEMNDLGFVLHTLLPWARSNEQAISRDLLSDREQAFLYAEYSLDALLRGDSAARAAFYRALAELEAITPNEVRRKENMPPLPGGNQVVKVPPKPAPRDRTDEDDERDPRGRPRGQTRAELIVVEAAARVVQKEIAAATKAAKRFAADAKGWQAWCAEFYTDHAGFIAHVLKLPSHQATQYAEAQCRALADKGVGVMQDWEGRIVPQLAALALGDDRYV